MATTSTPVQSLERRLRSTHSMIEPSASRALPVVGHESASSYRMSHQMAITSLAGPDGLASRKPSRWLALLRVAVEVGNGNPPVPRHAVSNRIAPGSHRRRGEMG